LFKALEDKLIPGIPQNLKIVLVSQIENDVTSLEIVKSDPNISVLEKVIKSDRIREKTLSRFAGEI
jgi:ATP-binding cassette, subfamily F, member 3